MKFWSFVFSELYVDGITSAGKTTVLELLQQSLSEAHIIPEFSRDIPERHRNIGPNLNLLDQLRAEYWFYFQYVEKDRQVSQLEGDVIVDRGILGLFPYSNLLGQDNLVSTRVMHSARQRLWTPGQHVFLIARPEVLLERLLTRQDRARITEKDWENGFAGFIEILSTQMKIVARQAGIPLIDTSEKTPQEVAEVVLELLQNNSYQ